jgi:hypothetical protein
MTCKKLKGYTPFKLVYDQEVVVPFECLVPNLRVAAIMQMNEHNAIQEIMNQLLAMEEDRILVGFHQQVQKARDKAWHDQHITE